MAATSPRAIGTRKEEGDSPPLWFPVGPVSGFRLGGLDLYATLVDKCGEGADGGDHRRPQHCGRRGRIAHIEWYLQHRALLIHQANPAHVAVRVELFDRSQEPVAAHRETMLGQSPLSGYLWYTPYSRATSTIA